MSDAARLAAQLRAISGGDGLAKVQAIANKAAAELTRLSSANEEHVATIIDLGASLIKRSSEVAALRNEVALLTTERDTLKASRRCSCLAATACDEVKPAEPTVEWNWEISEETKQRIDAIDRQRWPR